MCCCSSCLDWSCANELGSKVWTLANIPVRVAVEDKGLGLALCRNKGGESESEHKQSKTALHAACGGALVCWVASSEHVVAIKCAMQSASTSERGVVLTGKKAPTNQIRGCFIDLV